MATKFVSEKNLTFLLYDVYDLLSLTKFSYYKQLNRQLFKMVFDATLKLAKGLFLPCLQEMDKEPPELINGRVKVHPSVKEIMKECGEGGWIAAGFPLDVGGEQLPILFSAGCRFIFAAANYSASVYPDITAGAARLITNFGSEDLIRTYVPKMLDGQWQGTMALTEPQAGSSLADIVTMAEPTENGHYKIHGQKIFISGADHDGVDNVVHLILARIQGAPPGIKGISLFVMPNNRFDENGRLVFNDVTVSQVYHKLGYRGVPITELSIGEKNDCHGFLVGEPHKGLFYMFQLMNEARIGIGIGAAGIASAAYYAALEYTRDRLQGRKRLQKDPDSPQIPIIEHADIKRMLLLQRSVVEGSLALLLQCSKYADLENLHTGEEKEKYGLLLDLLIPAAKSYPSEMGIISVSQGLQCFGGYGYCDDFPLEQYYRDMRIHPIHEGTTGIQGIDLLGRKVIMKNGKAFRLYLEEVQKTATDAETDPELTPYARQLREAIAKLEEVTFHLTAINQDQNPDIFLADATLYLEFFSIIAVAWQWLLQAIPVQKAFKKKLSTADSNFYQGKHFAFRYFFAYELPKILGLAKRLMDNDPMTVEMKTDFFAD